MAQVEISINGREFRVTCEDGQEERLQRLAGYFDRHVSHLSADLGQIGDSRLMLLSALTVCDELFDAREKLSSMKDATSGLDEETLGGAARAIEAAVTRVNGISAKLDG